MEASKFSFSIWPPSERTRAAVVERMEKTLSSSSILSNKYGQFDSEEAHAVAKRIEEDAFTAAQDVATSESGDSGSGSGSHVLQFYSKEISKHMLDAAKYRASKNNQNSSPEEAINPGT